MTHTIHPGDIPALAAGLPPFPRVLQQLLELLEQESTSLDDLVRVVRTDPVISSAALSVANGLRRIRGQSDVTDLFSAATLIGTTKLHQIAVTSGMNRFLSNGSSQLYFYEHAVAVAIVAQELAMLAEVPPGEAYTAGILHDIGQLVYYSAAPNEYPDLRRQAMHEHDLLARERANFTLDHCQLGLLLGEHWKLPQNILLAISSHHDQGHDWKSRLQAIVNLAETLSSALDIPHSPYNYVQQVNASALAYLGLRWDSVEMPDLLARCRARFEYFASSQHLL